MMPVVRGFAPGFPAWRCGTVETSGSRFGQAPGLRPLSIIYPLELTLTGLLATGSSTYFLGPKAKK